MNEIKAAFLPVIGQIAWLVKRGHGSMLTLEFGKPHLEVRDPSLDSAVKDLRERRRVWPKGQWSLWIAWSYWKISAEKRTCSHMDEDHEKVDGVLSIIDGQKLKSVQFELGGRRLTLKFDLGGVLQAWLPTKPDHRGQDLWILNNHHKGYLVSCNNDGKLNITKVNKFEPGTIRIRKRKSK